jgi:hypothetical protein
MYIVNQEVNLTRKKAKEVTFYRSTGDRQQGLFALKGGGLSKGLASCPRSPVDLSFARPLASSDHTTLEYFTAEPTIEPHQSPRNNALLTVPRKGS